MSTNQKELYEYFLQNSAQLLEQYIGSALGTFTLKSNDYNCRQETWALLKKMILDAHEQEQSIAANRNTAHAIMTATLEGKFTAEQGVALMDVWLKACKN